MQPDKIKFGTDGWRAIIADTYTNTNVARVSAATALWLLKDHEQPAVVLGHDCRFGGPMFAEVATKVLCEHGVKVYLARGFVSTPMVSLGTLKLGAQAGVVITASHNPPAYNGFKLKAHFGGPAVPASIKEVEDRIPDHYPIPTKTLADYEEAGLIEYVPLEEMYLERIQESFDLDAIKKSGIGIGYDAMFGAGRNVMKQLFPEATLLHCGENPGFLGQAPEPIHKNLQEFSAVMAAEPDLQIGIANDGDADRIGVYDADGNYVDAHHVILLLVHYLHKYKGQGGKVVTAFSVTPRAAKLCEAYGLPQETTKIGFKYICEVMIQGNEDILLGGEESGGIAVMDHLPERDGIWMGLILLEFMAKTGKSLKELIQEIYAVTGPFFYNRNDLHIPNDQKWRIMDRCAEGAFTEFGSYKIVRTDHLDGYRFFLNDENHWVMIRPSGTEPVLRVYAEAPSAEKVEHVLEEVRAILKTV